MTPPDYASRFSRSLWLTLGIFVIFAILFVVYVKAEKQIDRANESRLQSHLLADELRQSSDDLSRMVHSYLITGNPIYKQHYLEILDIRDGKKPRPANYQNVYWDLVLADDRRPLPYTEQRIALLDLMRQAGFSEEEFAKLAQAKANSDALTATEYSAMKLIESTAVPTDANRLKASQMLSDTAYYQAKANIMRPIGEFYQLMNQRTLNEVNAAEHMAMLLRMVFISSGLLLLLVLWCTYRTLYNTLGSSVGELYRHITCLGRGDFSSAVPVAQGMENSILGWLSETQVNLAWSDALRKEAEARNRRMTQLYAALSQCNQAIVRCNNEHELFTIICRDAVTFGGMTMAWIGLLDEHSRLLKPVASYGTGTEYLAGIHISTDANEAAGRGPTGISVRKDQPFWCQDFQNDPVTAPWHERSAKFGWRASAALPLHKNGAVIGVFTLYSSEVNAFDEAARNLLIEMVIDIDYALNSFEREAQRRQAESLLADSHKLLKTIIDTAPIRVFWKDTNLRYMGCNPAFAKDAGAASAQDIIGKDDFQLIWKDQAEHYQTDDRWVMDLNIPKLAVEELKIMPDGTGIWLRTSKVRLQNEVNETIGVLGIYEDITEQKKIEERIHYLANFDPLTGLPNRTQLSDHLKYALSLTKRSNGSLALMFLDLDHFKDINDSLGHSTGDALLIELAKRLCKVLRSEDMVTRLGGDEFILLLPGVDANGAAQVAQKLLDAIAEPYLIELYDLSLTASIGIALYPEDGEDLEALSKSADAAMYRAKQEGRQCYRFFTQEMQARSARNLLLVNALHHALELGQLQIYYQPQISMREGHVIGAEALLRWQHPELGFVSPAEFIPVAEGCGLILPIGEWVLRQAVRQAKTWMNQGLGSLTMAVNLSAVQFRHSDLPELVTRILDEEDLPAEYLELELTESVAMHNPQGAIAIMDNLYDRGIRMSIDDFGTGYSSLSYLKKFKVYKLKIDQSFVRDITTDPEDKAIVSAIINLAKSLGLKTIAEGVETEGQQAFLHEQECDEMQGYLFSKPVPAKQFEALLKQCFVPG
ncbi:bifunctional diguanylate cyclase/phosphodiesterase [Candidatus Methylobacter oryzae]|uniref:EAL domain-containing protein n=1 Tax=Candidatus Methylobacter oryzae TaxID=2497749 RepID=A0ABY3CAN8_9GAMM|nr:EAL domain-containing protein [Candidatus Methylobacter oryzae]TRW95410.1 EAL domain-containing protein [Candidatus Methylobacter oryzae]